MRFSDWSSDVCSSDLLHPLDPRGAAFAGGEGIAVGKGAALGGHRYFALEARLGHQPFPHHDRGHAFGDCDKPLDRLARLEQREDIARIHSLLDLIFAGLDRLVRAEEARVIAKAGGRDDAGRFEDRSEERTAELQSLMRISYTVL